MRGIPAPEVLRRDVGAADPAVDAEQLDAVGLAVEHALAVVSSGGSAVARRRWRRSAAAGAEARLRRRSRRGRPGSRARGRTTRRQERCVLELLLGDERCERRARRPTRSPGALAVRFRTVRRPARAALRAAAASAFARKGRSGGSSFCASRASSRGSGARKASQTAAAWASVSGVAARRDRPERLELVGGEGAEERVDDRVSSGMPPVVACEREHVQQLQLVVQIVLEPQHDVGTPPRSASTSCRSLRSSDERIARRLPQPHSERNAARKRRSFRARQPRGTGPSCRTSCHGSTAPPSVVWRSVLPALSPFVDVQERRRRTSRPRRAR